MPLIDSDHWKAAFVKLNSLQFHPANPRLPEVRGAVSEHQIIEELCVRGKVEALARIIAEKGYLRNDRLIVVKNGSKNIVYEGNRRLCALKVLADPERAPVSMRRTFRKLSEKAKLPAKIAVDIVPTRFEAEVVMYTKHAGGEFMLGWKPLQQAAFVTAKLEQGESIEDLINTNGLSREQILMFQAGIGIYRLCRIAAVSDKAKKIVESPDDFPYSTVFQRLVEPKFSRAALGFEITEEGLLSPPDTEILPVLGKILEDAASDKINTRVLNNAKDQEKYIKGLRYKPSSAVKMSVDEIEAKQKQAESDEEDADTTPASNARQTTSTASKASTRLLPRSLVCEVQLPKLIGLVEEGKRMDIARIPNACAIFLRCLLDLALQNAMDERGCVAAIQKKYKKDRDRISSNLLLEDVKLATDFDIGLDSLEKRVITNLVKNGPLSYDALHLYIHNPHWTASKENVVHLRDAIIPIIRKALRKP